MGLTAYLDLQDCRVNDKVQLISAMPPKRITKAPKVEKKREPLNTFGLRADPVICARPDAQLQYDRSAFALRVPIENGAPLRIKLFKRITDQILPGHFEWHDWTYRTIEPLCELDVAEKESGKSYKLIGYPGCAGAAKTFNVVSFACAWWLMAPNISSVTLISTSKESLKKRGWSEVLKCYDGIPGPRFGNMVGSRMIWQCTKGDDKHAIFGKAVEEGPISKVADDIKGVHTERQMIVIDEATSVPAAIYEACGNLYSYPREFILALIGNPLNRKDQFGRFCEPKDGWTSVTVDTGEWVGKPQEQVGNRIPHIVTFDAEKSPNILSGREVSRHLPTKEGVAAAQKAGGGQTPSYWQNFRGFWPSEGLVKTVFSESSLKQNDAMGKHQFTGERFQIIGFFDPAFGGGDKPALRFAKLGMIYGGKWGIESLPPKILPIDANSLNPVHFQLTEQLRRECETININGTIYSCPPENLGIDATGEGGGLCDIVQRTWSRGIIRVEFGGSASEDSASLEDVRPANEVYENKRAELYFRGRDMVNHAQFKGLDKATCEELVTIMFEGLKPDGSSRRRLVIQSKKEYKALYKKSPDLSDCACGLSEVARIKGFRLAPIGQTKTRVEEVSKKVEVANSVYDSTFEAEEHDEQEAYAYDE